MKPSERIAQLASGDETATANDLSLLRDFYLIGAIIRYLDEQAEPKDTYSWCAKHDCPKTLMSHPPQCAACAQEPPHDTP